MTQEPQEGSLPPEQREGPRDGCASDREGGGMRKASTSASTPTIQALLLPAWQEIRSVSSGSTKPDRPRTEGSRVRSQGASQRIV